MNNQCLWIREYNRWRNNQIYKGKSILKEEEIDLLSYGYSTFCASWYKLVDAENLSGAGVEFKGKEKTFSYPSRKIQNSINKNLNEPQNSISEDK